MGKWIELLDSEILETLSSGTDKTDERGVLSVLAVQDEGVFENSRPADDDRRPVVAQRCADCRRLTRVKTCAEPVAAGLLAAAEGFGIAWPPAGHAASCAAFSSKAPVLAQDRPYKLTPEQGDAAHADPWDDATIARFQARVLRLARLGFDADDADDLAEQMHLRDVHADFRHLCLECGHLAGRVGAWRCGNHRQAQVAAELPHDLAEMFQHCGGFKP